jgi:hypothetical protein
MSLIKSFKEWLNEEENTGTYVSMKVKNKEELYDWFADQNVEVVPEDELHCTVSYSRKVFEHNVNEDEVIITPDQFIGIELLGDEGAVVLKFNSDKMQDRFNQCMREGATYDYNEYIPHITLTYNGKDLDLSKLELPIFDIVLYNETVEPLDLNWKSKVINN